MNHKKKKSLGLQTCQNCVRSDRMKTTNSGLYLRVERFCPVQHSYVVNLHIMQKDTVLPRVVQAYINLTYDQILIFIVYRMQCVFLTLKCTISPVCLLTGTTAHSFDLENK